MISKSDSSGIRSSGSQQWTLAEGVALIFEMKDVKFLVLKVTALALSLALLEVSSISCGKNSSLIRLWVWEWRSSQSARSWASRQAHLLCCQSLWTWHPTWGCSWNSWQASDWKQWHGEARSSSPVSSHDDSLASGKVIIPNCLPAISWYSVELWLLFRLRAYYKYYTASLHSSGPWAVFAYSMRTD